MCHPRNALSDFRGTFQGRRLSSRGVLFGSRLLETQQLPAMGFLIGDVSVISVSSSTLCGAPKWGGEELEGVSWRNLTEYGEWRRKECSYIVEIGRQGAMMPEAGE